jgi:Acetyltransferase (GNAT) domain
MAITLRTFADSDLDALFTWESDPRAVQMAAFTRANPSDRSAFDAHYERVRSDPSNTLLAIEDDGEFVGTIGSFTMEGEREVTYWIAPAQWGPRARVAGPPCVPCDRIDQTTLWSRGQSQCRVGEGARSSGLCGGGLRNVVRARSWRRGCRAYLSSDRSYVQWKLPSTGDLHRISRGRVERGLQGLVSFDRLVGELRKPTESAGQVPVPLAE